MIHRDLISAAVGRNALVSAPDHLHAKPGRTSIIRSRRERRMPPQRKSRGKQTPGLGNSHFASSSQFAPRTVADRCRNPLYLILLSSVSSRRYPEKLQADLARVLQISSKGIVRQNTPIVAKAEPVQPMRMSNRCASCPRLPRDLSSNAIAKVALLARRAVLCGRICLRDPSSKA